MNRKRLISIILAITLFIPAVLLDRISGLLWAYFPLYLASYITAGWMVVKKAAKNIVRGEIFDENFLMLIASVGAFVLNFVFSFDGLFSPGGGEEMMDGVLVMILYQVGEYFQGRAVQRSRKNIRSLLSIRPDIAYVLRDGKTEAVYPDEIMPGELFVVSPGEKVALDGVIVSGSCYLDTSAVTGESEPVFASEGASVLSGMICFESPVTIKALKPFTESTASRMLKLVEEAAEKKARHEQFITRFARVYTPIVCALSLLVMIVPPTFLLLLNDVNVFSEWIYNGLCLLVISCPCALVISVPLTFFGGIGGLAKNNILLKGADCFESIASCDVVAFDKTGTITSGSFEVSSVDGDENEVLSLAGCVEKHFSHPIAKSITKRAGDAADKYVASDVKDFPGKGVSAVINGKTILAGNALLLTERGIEIKVSSSPFTAVYVAYDNKHIGTIIISDRIKEDSAKAVAKLKEMNITSIMLTGDRKEVAEAVSAECGIERTHYSLLPEDKTIIIKKYQSEGHKIIFAGDGINDAPALATADIGCAMGGVGSDAAIEAADMVIMKDSLSTLVTAKKHSKKVISVALQNIIGSLVIKAALMVMAIVIPSFPLWIAIIGDVGVCLVAIINAMRTLSVK
ncbi:MAG: cadmium-translocating P-type ATPase [Clostridia bacterium]|nr:cadmium-translocating P-type ATPase [Clostridia bacterium]